MLRDATLTSLKDILAENEIPYELRRSENTLEMQDTGSRIIFRPVDEFERLRGTNLAWFGVDELTYCHEEAWIRLEGRLRDPKATVRRGFAVWTPKGFDWVYRRFIQNPVKGYEVVQAKPYENRFILDATPDFYERLKGSYDENFFRQEVLGDYLNLQGGLVYSAFSRETNVKRVAVNPAARVCWAVDFNVDPMSSVIVQLEGDLIHVVDEIVLRRASTPDACEEFGKRIGKPAGGVTVYGDSAGNAQQTTGFSDYDLIRKFFEKRQQVVDYRVPTANPPVRERVAMVNSLLKAADGYVRLYVDPKCKELIADFEQVAYREDSMQIDKERDRRRTHLSDALGYLICEELRPRRSVGERRERLF
jgi:hypothetical protein